MAAFTAEKNKTEGNKIGGIYLTKLGVFKGGKGENVFLKQKLKKCVWKAVSGGVL